MKIKIGILTYHRTTNYGAAFQTFALQHYLNENGYDAEVIDYVNKTIKNRYELNIFKSKKIKQFIKRALSFSENYKLNKYFEDFTNKKIKLSSVSYSEENISECDNKYDLFLFGSDQIWNFKLSGYDYNYFGVFTNDKKKRNSYAASSGTIAFSEGDKENFLDLIKQQNFISVREDNLYNFIKETTSCKKIYQSIDPVFLLEKRYWITLAEESTKKYSDNYIVLYEVTYVETLLDFTLKLSKKYNLKIYYISASNKKIKHENLEVISPSPIDFLKLLENAKYVVTSSFHGMALSIILNKEFYYDAPSSQTSNSSRLESLAKLLNLENRKISSKKINHDSIDYNEVNKIIKDETKKSKEYIESVIEDVKKKI